MVWESALIAEKEKVGNSVYPNVGVSDPGWDDSLSENIVWGGKKEPSSTDKGSGVCPVRGNEGTEMPNAGKKMLHSLPARYVPFEQLQSVKESVKECSRGIHCKESLKEGVRPESSTMEQSPQIEATGKAMAQTGKEMTADKSGPKQRGKAVPPHGQASTSKDKNRNFRMTGKTKGKGRCQKWVVVSGCNLDRRTVVTSSSEDSKVSVQGNAMGNCTFSSNTTPSCESTSKMDNVSYFSTYKNEDIEGLNQGKALENVSLQQRQTIWWKASNEKNAAFRGNVSGRRDVENGMKCPKCKSHETYSRTLKSVQHSGKQSEESDFKGSSVSTVAAINVRERSNQRGHSFVNAKEIGDNGYERHGNLEKETDGREATSLELPEDERLASEEPSDGGICVSHPFPIESGKPPSINRGEGGTATISVLNNTKISVKLLAVKLVHSNPSNSFSLSLNATEVPGKSIQCHHKTCLSSVNSFEFETKTMPKLQVRRNYFSLAGGPWLIEPGHHLIIHLSCVAKDIGLHRSSILFDFQNLKITRHVTLLAEDEVSKQLAPTEPYFGSWRRKTGRFHRFIRGAPPPLPMFQKQLKGYPIPNNLNKNVGKKLPRVLEEGLSVDTYSGYFSTLLYLEELQMKADITAYDMHHVAMRHHFDYLVLKVPGLSEKRPSLIYGDHICVTFSGVIDKAFQGYIYKVEADEIFLKFDKSFHEKFIPNLKYDVRFSFSRINLRRGHQAIEAAGGMPVNILFPCKRLSKMTWQNTAKVSPFNRALNAEQLSVVCKILDCHDSLPYIIYGPPGTGKTVTIVEAILQILKNNPKAHVLACAPSNSASDLLLERLLGSIQQRDIFRLNASTRQYQDVPSELLPYCSSKGSFFNCPPIEELLKYKIIISTCISAAMLVNQVPRGHFTHIFLDESGQCTEPETMVPIANLATTGTTVVLAGDPQQLGPIVRSPIAEKFGLGKSYLERLSKLQLYSLDGDNKEFVTKLVRNYRSHPAILEIPSQLFYGGDLIACAAKESWASLCDWEELPNKKFPVLFVGIEGCDEREGTSPSWFNTVEVSKVIEIIKKLKCYKRSRVSGKDIGVITPYQRQVVKLKKALAANTLSDIKVGSVEQFQGEEKRVIIISTVRSCYKYEELDTKYNLGFLQNAKRFNVAVTRAKSLLVVVGNPHILSKDKYWNELLQHCAWHRSYIGCSLLVKNRVEDDIIRNDKLSSSDCLEDGSSSNPSLPTKATIEEAEWPDGTL